MVNKDAKVPTNIWGDPVNENAMEDMLQEFEDYMSGISEANAKRKNKDLYCNCEEPDVVRAGFNRTYYDYCKCCKKEKV